MKSHREAKIEIRSCEGFGELEACVQLQIETWGYDASDVIPRKAFWVAQKIGGQVIGAFQRQGTREQGNEEKTELVGFAMALPGIKSNGGAALPYLHSHQLAVREAWRNRGLGAQLKLEQRSEALSRGIGLMEWTFDPLEIKNAYLNIKRLGVIAREYRENFYGYSSSRLQSGLPTDRLLAEWRLDSPRVERVLSKGATEEICTEERIAVPSSIYKWKATEADRERAREVQMQNREKFQRAFAKGLAVIGFTVDGEGNGIYELGNFPAV
jgi:predicted GNAT superfamily acetyltransferase